MIGSKRFSFDGSVRRRQIYVAGALGVTDNERAPSTNGRGCIGHGRASEVAKSKSLSSPSGLGLA